MRAFSKRLLATCVASTLFATNIALADQLKLKNGDVITGKVIRKGKAAVKIKTSYAGELKIAWDQVASIDVDEPVTVMLKDGTVTKSAIEPKANDQYAVKGAEENVSLAQIQLINPTAAESGIGRDWSGRINLSGAMTKGNVDNAAVRLSGEAVSNSKDNRYTIGAIANRAESNSVDIEENLRLYGQYDKFLSEKWYVYTNASFEYDPFRDINLRSRLGTGAGYSIFRTEEKSLDVELGLSYIRTDFDKAEDDSTVAGRWALRYNQDFFDGNLVAFHNHEILFGLQNLNDSLIYTQTGVRFPINAHLNATSQLNVDYAKTPAPGRKSTDTSFLVGLDYGW